jgi:hypothetical protein
MTNLSSPLAKPAGLESWGYSALVTAVPALLWWVLVQRFGLPVFYEDDWSMIPFIVKLREGTLHFADYWAPMDRTR